MVYRFGLLKLSKLVAAQAPPTERMRCAGMMAMIPVAFQGCGVVEAGSSWVVKNGHGSTSTIHNGG